MPFALEFITSSMRHRGPRVNIIAALRSVAALVLMSSFSLSFAQVPVDTREAKLALAAKEAKSAIELANEGTAEASTKAIQKLKTAETIYAELEEKDKLLPTVSMIGNLQLGLRQTDAAIVTLTKAIAIARELNKAEQEIRILVGLGVYFFQGSKTSTENKRRAKDYLEQAATVTDRTEPKPEPLSYDTYELLGDVWTSLYNPANAQKAYLKAYAIEKNKPPEKSIPALLKYARKMMEMGFPMQAVRPLEEARQKAIAAKLPELEVIATYAIGDLMAGKFRNLPKAKQYLDRVEVLLKTSPDDASLYPRLLLSWGKYYFAAFELNKAADHYAKALQFETKMRPYGLRGEVLLNFGVLNFTLGNYEAAITLLEEATLRTEGEELIEMEALRYLARSQNALGKRVEARTTIAKAMKIRGDSGQGYFSAESVALLIDYSNFLIQSNSLPQARGLLDLAYRTAKRERMADLESLSAQRLSLVYSIPGDYPTAIGILNDSLVAARSAGLPVQEASALTELMDISEAMNNKGAATFYGKNAVNVYQQLRKRIADLPTEVRVGYLTTIEGTYRKLASLLVEQGRIAEAEQVLTMLKEEELLEYVRRDDSVAKTMLDTVALTETERAAMTRYSEIANQITTLGKEFDQLEKERLALPANQFPKQQRYLEVSKQLEDARVTFQKFLEELKLKFGEDDKRVAQVVSSLKKTLEQMQANRTAIVSTIVGQDTLNIIVTTSRTQRAHTIKVGSAEINDQVAKLREALRSPQYDPRPIAQKFYNWIVKPIEADLAGINADTIAWSLDGSLRYLPPSVFWDKEKGYLAERFANVMVNLANRTSLKDERVKGKELSILGVGVSKAAEGFSPLAAVPDELDCIVSDGSAGSVSVKPQCATGVLNGRKLLDEKFTWINFEGELGRYPIIHIASHFKLIPGDEKNSFLLLGGGTDRKLSVEMLRSKSLGDLELMVLSACNTATPAGNKTNGIEVESFSTIAQEEARAVIATLWPVADTSTKDLMVEFYRLYGKEGLSKAEAMRRAQLKLMHGQYSGAEAIKVRADEFVTTTSSTLTPFKSDPKAPFAHPFYWSPFTLSGNWR